MPRLGCANLSIASLTNRAILCSTQYLLGCFQYARQIHWGHFIIHTCKSGNWLRAVKCLPVVTQLLQCRARCRNRNDRATPPHPSPAPPARLPPYIHFIPRETWIDILKRNLQRVRQLLVVIHLRSQLYVVFWMTSSRPMVISLVCHWI